MGITVNGLVSGLDSASIVQKLVELEKRPVTLLQDKQQKNNDQLAAWQDMRTKLLTLETAVNKINTAAKFRGTTATFTNNDPSAASIMSLTTSGTAASGTYSFTVNSLAKQHKMLSSTGYASTSTSIGVGSMSITKGGVTQTFTQNTLDDLRTAINTSGLGVTATVVNGGTTASPNYRMLLSSNSTGADQSFTVDVAVGQNGLGPEQNSLAFNTTQQATDTSVTLDGSLTVNRSSNTITDLLDGVSMNITGTGSGTIVVGNDNATTVKNVQDFATAYNDVIDYTREQNVYTKDQDTKPLFANSTLLTIQAALRSIVSSPVGGLSNEGGYNALSQVGIMTDINNHLSVDSTALTQALNTDPVRTRMLFAPAASGTYSFVSATGATTAGVYDTRVTTDGSGNTIMQMRRQGTTSWITMEQAGNFFEGPASSELDGFSMRATNLTMGETGTMTVSVGVAEKLSYRVGYFTEFSTEGAITNEKLSLEKKNSDLQGQIDAINLRIKKKTDDLTAKYARLETVLSQLKSQSDYLGQQLGTLSAGWKR